MKSYRHVNFNECCSRARAAIYIHISNQTARRAHIILYMSMHLNIVFYSKKNFRVVKWGKVFEIYAPPPRPLRVKGGEFLGSTFRGSWSS